MPILDVELVGPLPNQIRDGLAARIAESAARVLMSRPQGTWVKLRFIAETDYAENAGGPPPGSEPVIVHVLEAEPSEGDALATQAQALTEAIAEACGRSSASVHLIYEAPARGRIAFGGKLRR